MIIRYLDPQGYSCCIEVWTWQGGGASLGKGKAILTGSGDIGIYSCRAGRCLGPSKEFRGCTQRRFEVWSFEFRDKGLALFNSVPV